MNDIILEEIRLEIKEKTRFDLGKLNLVLEIIDHSETIENIPVLRS